VVVLMKSLADAIAEGDHRWRIRGRAGRTMDGRGGSRAKRVVAAAVSPIARKSAVRSGGRAE